MNGWIIAVIAVIAVIVILVIAVLLVFSYLRIKKKIRNKLIDKGTDIIAKAAGNYLGEEAAGKVNEATNATAKLLKNGKKADIAAAAAKKVLEAAKKRNK